VRQLNERLGMGHTFIHDRYGSKDAFWRAVMGSAGGHVTDEVEAALDGEQPGDDLAWLTPASAPCTRPPHAVRASLTSLTTKRPGTHRD
jgi:hypothetical protein